MPNPPIPEEPNFIKNIEALQKVLSGIAVTMFFITWITGFDFVKDIFRPDFVLVLTILRVSIATVSLSITSLVGYNQLRKMFIWGIDSWEIYKQMLELKKKDDEGRK